jgi:hypothetical protein
MDTPVAYFANKQTGNRQPPDNWRRIQQSPLMVSSGKEIKMTTPMQEVTVNQPYEAGFSTNFFLSHPLMGRQQFTFRGAFATDWGYVMEESKTFIKYMQEKGWAMEGEGKTPAPAPQPDVAAKIALEAGNKVMAQELQAQSEAVPPAPNGQQWNTTDVNEIRIEPKSDGMVSVEFWQTGRKYAEEYVKWKPENILGLLKHVMTVPVNDDGTIKPAVVSCKCRVFYSLGKEKTGPNAKPGSRWHDVAHVRAIL